MPAVLLSPSRTVAEAFNDDRGAPALADPGLIIGDHATTVFVLSTDRTHTIGHRPDAALANAPIDRSFVFASECARNDDPCRHSLISTRAGGMPARSS